MQKRQEVRAECEKSPDTCKEKRDALRKDEQAQHKELREKMRAKCDADPKACEAKKAEMREKMQERREKRSDKAAPAAK